MMATVPLCIGSRVLVAITGPCGVKQHLRAKLVTFASDERVVVQLTQSYGEFPRGTHVEVNCNRILPRAYLDNPHIAYRFVKRAAHFTAWKVYHYTDELFAGPVPSKKGKKA